MTNNLFQNLTADFSLRIYKETGEHTSYMCVIINHIY